MNKAWEPPKKFRVDGQMVYLSTFDFTAMKEFLDNFVYKDGDREENVVDIGNSNARPSAYDSSVDKFWWIWWTFF